MSYSPIHPAKRKHALASAVAISLCSANAAVAATDYIAPARINAGEQWTFARGDTLTHSGNGYALTVNGSGALASGEGLALRLTGQQGGSAGIQVTHGGRVLLNHADIDSATAARSPKDIAWATGVGSLLQLDDANIQAARNANGGGAFDAEAGAGIVFNDGSVTAGRVGDTFHLLTVSGAGSTIEFNRTQVHLSGTASLTVGSQGRLGLNAAALGGHAGVLALHVSGAGAQLDATNLSLANARYHVSHGGLVRLQDSAVENTEGSVFMLLGSAGATAGAEVQGGRFTASGDYVLNTNNHSRFSANKLTLVSRDAESAVWVAADTSTLTLDHARIATSGQAGNGSGIMATGGTTTLRHSSIDTHADKAYAVRATGSSSSSFNRLTIEDSHLHTWGAGGAGVLVGGGTVDARLHQVQVTTAGIASTGILQINTARLTVTGSTVDTRGANAAAYRAYMTQAGDYWGNVSFTGGELRTSDAAALWLQGANHQLSLQGTEVSAGSATEGHGLLLRVSDTLFNHGSSVRTGKIRINASAASLKGNVHINSGTADTRLRLADGTRFTGALLGNNGQHVAEMHVLDSSIWHMTGNSELGGFTHQGTVDFVAPATAGRFKQLQITGDYAGIAGQFVLNTELSGDHSPTDTVHIAGHSAGVASLRIVNVAGAGAVTRQGIQVVQVDGRSEARFTLDGRAVAGAYEYFLDQGGRDTPEDGDWYLRSSRRNTPDDPVMRPEVGAYQTNQLLAAHMFDHSSQDRLGEAVFAERPSVDGGGQVWLRAVRNQVRLPSGRQTLPTDSDSDLLQLGAELIHGYPGQGRIRMGVMGGVARAQTHVGSIITGYQAKGQVKGRSLGIYGTWLASAEQRTGLYVDSWLQYGRYNEEVRGGYLQAESYGAHTWTGSVEAGYRWQLPMGERSVAFLLPQLQVLYTDYHARPHREANGTRVEATQAGGLSTRLGVSLFGHATDAGMRRVHPFVSVNWEHRARANIVSFNGVEMEQDVPRELYEAKLGAEVALGGGWTGWAHMAIQKGAGNYRDVEGQLSVGYHW